VQVLHAPRVSMTVVRHVGLVQLFLIVW
jgi:hypothetical protein